MKRAGTLKLEIIKPDGERWTPRIGPRLRHMRSALPLALNFAFRDVFPSAMAELEATLDGKRDKANAQWRNDVRKRLAFHWARQLERRRDYKPKRGQRFEPVDATVFDPVGDVWCSETSDHIVSRFAGEHFKALLAGRAGVPTFEGGGKAFYAEGRKCEASGTPDEARLTVPLWGSGKKATRLVVAPCGNSARALWHRLVADSERREEIVALERAAKTALPKDGTEQQIAEARAERERAAHALIELGALKMGKVGIKYDERKRKWYALISWSEYCEEGYIEGQAAAVNFGCHVLLQALAEKGEIWERTGTDVLVMRRRFQARRWSLGKAKRSHGSGGRGRGVKRRELPLRKLSERETRWVENWIRVTAADFVKWCLEHRVSDVHLEDLSGVREAFERSTGGEAHEELKRLIHNWPYYQAQQAIERQCAEHGIRCHYKAASWDSQRCPSCRHTAPGNVKTMEVSGATKLIDGDFWRKVEKRSRFECEKCGLKHAGDVITCANHLLDVGKTHALEKMQEAARKRSKIARGSVRKEAKPTAAE